MSATPSRTISPLHEAFYISSMLFNAQSADRSLTQINAVLHVIAENSPENPMEALPVFYLLGELQNLVSQCAALSRYFWPVRAAHAWRGKQLREVFGVSDESPLRSRDLRNDFEHFDEQLDLYLDREIVGYVLPEYVGPFPNEQQVPLHLFRAYYVDTGVFELLSKRYDIAPLASEMRRIFEKLRLMDSQGGRLNV